MKMQYLFKHYPKMEKKSRVCFHPSRKNTRSSDIFYPVRLSML